MESYFTDLVRKRRSIYQLNREIELSEAEVISLIQAVLKDAPTAFNNQSSKIMILLDGEHEKLWEIVRERLRPEMKGRDFSRTDQKMDGFKAAYGTVLFFDDQSVTKRFKEENPLYKDNFDTWAQQANGILQYGIWLVLAEHNIGASLQHYNPLIDEEVRKTWDIPEHYQLIAQMPFGGIVAPADEKEYDNINERMSVKR